MHILKSSIITAAAFIACSLAHAQFSGAFTFPATGADGNVSSFAYNGAAITGLTISPITKNGVTSSSSGGNYRASGWSTGAANGSDAFTGARDLTDYFEFTITADAGYVFDITGLNFGVGRSATGPRQFGWASNIDSYSTLLSVGTANVALANNSGVLTVPDSDSNWVGNSIVLSGESYSALESITFRFYAWNSEASGGTGGLQGPLTFTGLVVAQVPEPSAYAALAGALVLSGVIMGRRRRAAVR